MEIINISISYPWRGLFPISTKTPKIEQINLSPTRLKFK